MINILIVVIVILIISFIIGLIITGNGEHWDNETKLTDNPSVLFEDENTAIAFDSKINVEKEHDHLDVPIVEDHLAHLGEDEQSLKDDQFDDEII